jgi:oligosaccharide repeat unit polymerase
MLETLLLFISLLLLALGSIISNYYILTFGLFFIYVADFIFVWKKKQQRRMVLFFLVSFFTFLLGRILLYTFTGLKWWSDISKNEALVVIRGIYLALLCLPIGIVISEHTRLFRKAADEYSGTITTTSKTLSIRQVAAFLFWTTLAANVYEILNQVIFVIRNSYIESYLSYGGVGIIVSRLASVNKIAFFLFLATNPPKQQAKQPIIIWTILNMVSLLSGGRTTAVITLLVLLYYFIYRDEHLLEDEAPWLTGKMKRIMIIATPIFIVFLAAWNYLRNSQNVDLGFASLFFNFFERQGGSYKLLAYATRYSGKLPQKFYTFGPVINFLRGNIFISALTGFKMPAQNTVAAATSGYSYGQAISYIIQPWNYLAGLGLGSSYLAELYYDFGYIGIALFNIILGVLLSILSRTLPNNVMSIFFMLVILDSILNLPRNACLDWFTSLTSVTLWGTLLIV